MLIWGKEVAPILESTAMLLQCPVLLRQGVKYDIDSCDGSVCRMWEQSKIDGPNGQRMGHCRFLAKEEERKREQEAYLLIRGLTE